MKHLIGIVALILYAVLIGIPAVLLGIALLNAEVDINTVRVTIGVYVTGLIFVTYVAMTYINEHLN